MQPPEIAVPDPELIKVCNGIVEILRASSPVPGRPRLTILFLAALLMIPVARFFAGAVLLFLFVTLAPGYVWLLIFLAAVIVLGAGFLLAKLAR